MNNTNEARADMLRVLDLDAPFADEVLDAALAEVADPATIERVERFRVTSPALADWVGRKRLQATTEIDEIDEMVDGQIRALELWREKAKRPATARVAWADGHLITYANDVAGSTGKRKVALPSVTITGRAAAPKLDVADADVFIEWAEKECPAAVKKTPLKSELGARLVPGADGKLVAMVDGERVPGVEVVEPEPGLKVRLCGPKAEPVSYTVKPAGSIDDDLEGDVGSGFGVRFPLAPVAE